MSSPPARPEPTRVWDAWTRLFHWSIVLLAAFSWGSAENRDVSPDMMMYHRWSGYAALGLLVFRVYWGFAGASTARFAEFVKGPRAIGAYLRAHKPVLGHNPLGALSVLALLAVLIVQVVLGLFAVDIDGFESGPLSYLVDFDPGRQAAELHELSFNILLGLIALHLLAILYYLVFRRDNLIGPMITGAKRYPEGVDLAARFAPLWRVLPGIAIAGAVVWIVMKGFQL